MGTDINFQDAGNLLNFYNRPIVDTGIIGPGSTNTVFNVKLDTYIENQFKNYFIHFFKGDLAFSFFKIVRNTNNTIEVRPDRGVAPSEGDIFAIIKNPSKSFNNGLFDQANRQTNNTVFGDLISASRFDDVSQQFQYNIPTEGLNQITANGGTVTQADSMAVLNTSTNATGSAILHSTRGLRYRPGHEGICYFTALFTVNGSPGNQEGIAGSQQFIGLNNNDEDGIFIGFDGLEFGIHRLKAGSLNTVTQSNFNLDKLDGSGPSGISIDFSKLNVWRISYGWLGASPIIFEVMNSQGNWIPFHSIEFPNTTAGTTINNPVLPVSAKVVKTAGSTEVILKTASWNAATAGDFREITVGNRFFASFNQKNISGNTLTNILTLRSKETFQGKTNRVRSVLNNLSSAKEGGTLGLLGIFKNATLGGTPSFNDIDSVNSVMEIDTDGTTVSGGKLELQFSLAAGGQFFTNIRQNGIEILPGESLTFAAFSSQTTDISAATRWEEQF